MLQTLQAHYSTTRLNYKLHTQNNKQIMYSKLEHSFYNMDSVHGSLTRVTNTWNETDEHTANDLASHRLLTSPNKQHTRLDPMISKPIPFSPN